jgi:hypothetical protein
MRQNTLVLAVVAAISLTGCGTLPTGSFAAPSPSESTLQNTSLSAQASVKAPVASVVTAPLISSNAASLVSAGAAQSQNFSTLMFSDGGALSDSELQADAGIGYSVQAILPTTTPIGTAFEKTGTLRQSGSGFEFDVTAGSGFLGLFHKTSTTYALTGPSAILAKLSTDANKKVEITGMLNGTTVTALEVEKALSFDFLSNWLTKGKIKGQIRDAAGSPISGATVEATDNNGFEFTAVTENDGDFAIKNLTPGAYTLNISKAGYNAATGSTTVQKRHSVHAVALLNPKTI